MIVGAPLVAESASDELESVAEDSVLICGGVNEDVTSMWESDGDMCMVEEGERLGAVCDDSDRGGWGINDVDVAECTAGEVIVRDNSEEVLVEDAGDESMFWL